MTVRIRILGAPVVERDGAEAPVVGERVGSLLALLCLRAGDPVPAPALAAAVWGEAQPANTTNALQALVSRLRRAIGTDLLVGEAGTYRLDVDPFAVDAATFAASVERGAAANRGLDHERAARLLAGALADWRGPLLAGAGVNGPLAVEAVRLDELHEVAWEERLDAELGLGRHEAAVPAAERLVASQPLRERRWGQLMLALYRSGRQADALRAFQRLRALLVDRLGIEPSRSIVELERSILDQDPALDWRPGARAVTRPTNVRATDVVGRDEEIKAVQTAVEANRAVLVVGPGGVGKTTLAKAAGLSLDDDLCPDGLWLADLTGATTLADARAIVAAAVPGSDADSVDDRLARLDSADALVVLDGCEHLGGVAVQLAGDLLGAGERIRVLLTSRIRFTGGFETVDVGGLDAEDALALFRRRAAAAGVDEPGADEAIAVLVDALDRLPLAIELAAARARYLSVGELCDRLDERLRIFRSTAGDGRHGSLAAVLDESHALLSDRAKVVYRRLAALPGSFTIDAAAAVAGGDDVLDLVVELTDHSLLSVGRTPGGPRYRYLDTVAAHAATALDAAGERAECERRLVAWAVDVCTAAAAAIDTPDEVDELARLDREQELIAGAFAAADPAARAVMARGLWVWWDVRGRAVTGAEQIDEVLRTGVVDDRPGEEAWLRFALGQLLERAGELDRSMEELARARDAGRALGDSRLVARAVGTIAFIHINAGRLDAARPIVEEASAAAERSGDLVASLAALNVSAYLAYSTGRRHDAVALWEAAGDAARHGGLVRRRPLILGNLGSALDAAGDESRALAVLEEALEAAVDAGDLQQVALTKANMIAPYRSMGRHDDATRVATEAVDTLMSLGDERTATRPLAHVAELALEAEDRPAAHAAAIRLTEIARRRSLEVEETLGLRLQGMVAAAYGRHDQAVAFYRGVLEKLPPNGYADAWGRNLELLGRSLLALGDRAGALDALTRARETFATLDNEPLDELDQLIARTQSELRASTTCS